MFLQKIQMHYLEEEISCQLGKPLDETHQVLQEAISVFSKILVPFKMRVRRREERERREGKRGEERERCLTLSLSSNSVVHLEVRVR